MLCCITTAALPSFACIATMCLLHEHLSLLSKASTKAQPQTFIEGVTEVMPSRAPCICARADYTQVRAPYLRPNRCRNNQNYILATISPNLVCIRAIARSVPVVPMRRLHHRQDGAYTHARTALIWLL